MRNSMKQLTDKTNLCKVTKKAVAKLYPSVLKPIIIISLQIAEVHISAMQLRHCLQPTAI